VLVTIQNNRCNLSGILGHAISTNVRAKLILIFHLRAYARKFSYPPEVHNCPFMLHIEDIRIKNE
jgi:hypothetical protein